MSDGSDVDESLFNASRLGDLVDQDGRIEPDHVAAATADLDVVQALTVFEQAYDPSSDVYDDDQMPREFAETELGSDLIKAVANQATATDLGQGRDHRIAAQTGLADDKLDLSNIDVLEELQTLVENNGAPSFIVASGPPNTGKTATLYMLLQVYKSMHPEATIVSNVLPRSDNQTDKHVHSMTELFDYLLEHPDEPKALFLDEGSTWFNARTFQREVSNQFDPISRRFAKIGVDLFCTVSHDKYDVCPSVRRLVNDAGAVLEKTAVDEMTVYETWEDDELRDRRAAYEGIPHPDEMNIEYDQNDIAPWNWNLDDSRLDQLDEELQ